MQRPQAARIGQARDALMVWLHRVWTTLRRDGPSEVQFWFIALIVGLLAGLAALGFRLGIEALQSLSYGTPSITRIHRAAATIEWYWLVLIPATGGLAAGLILNRFTPDARVRAVADVIEGAALREGRVERREGLAAAAVSLITLGTGGSSGREGPVVHIAAMISTTICRWMRADPIKGRDLLGCAVAAAVSASFNAPIAGALFALEVVLRHFAVHAFAPIVIASVAGTVISRTIHGDTPEYILSSQTVLGFYTELPAFLILGLVSGLVAVALMKSIFLAEDLSSRWLILTGLPRWARPTVAGAMVGVIAIWFPHVIGVGYGITSDALSGRITFWTAILFLAVKIAAVAITIGGRMGGGVFSPALVSGALLGLPFGILATQLFPDSSGSATLYALAGMGAVAAAVLGAPISTTLIIFELTGDWQTGLAVMVAVSLSTALASRLVDRSYFLTQLERRGVHLAAGPQAWLLGTVRCSALMRDADPDTCWAMIRDGNYVDASATLERALPRFEATGADFLPVVRLKAGDSPPELLGAVWHVDALRAFNRKLAEVAAEEHS